MSEAFWEDLARDLDIDTGSPEFREAYEKAQRYVEQPCSEGCCVELIDPETGENKGGWGPVGCPCQDD